MVITQNSKLDIFDHQVSDVTCIITTSSPNDQRYETQSHKLSYCLIFIMENILWYCSEFLSWSTMNIW